MVGRAQHAGARIGDVREHGRLFGDVALHGRDKVWDQVEPPLLHDVHLRVRLIDVFILLNQGVSGAHITAKAKKHHHHDHRKETETDESTFFHCFLTAERDRDTVCPTLFPLTAPMTFV